ncbi:MAG TPA: S8 family serine peptidase, partial [Candidatus Limnocylindria bacterium]|nr:S8 family serine peptidase [Candidatus Limnocylindria bacterium]
MPRTLLIVPALVLLAASTMPAHAAQATPTAATPRVAAAPPSGTSGPAFASDRVIVRWKDASKAAERANAHHATVVASLATPSHSVLRTQGRSVAAMVAELRRDPDVVWAEPDYVVQLEESGTQAVSVDDPLTDDQYALDRMQVRDAWTRSTGGTALIAVLDTGVQFTHPDLVGRLAAGYDFVNGDTDARDDNGHGTWVSGILVANANNAIGVAGISWSDKVLPVKVMNSSGLGYTSDLAAGIYYAADRGAKVINMSVGGFPNVRSVGDAVDYAWSKGAVLVAAAGNHGVEELSYPASYPHVVSVSATQADDEFTNWSSYGAGVDVSAPGAAITTTDCGGCSVSAVGSPRYTAISGTSFATPDTAGVVALIAAEYPGATNAWIVDRLTSTTDDLGTVGWDDHYGTGRVNAYRALGANVPRVAPPSGDGYEPNETVAAARRLGIGTTYHPTNYPAGDVDVFAFDVPRAGKLTVTVTAVVDNTRLPKSSLPFDPVLELLASDGVTRLAWTDGPYSPDTETASDNVSVASRIYARVTNWFPNGTQVAYSIRSVFVDEIRPGIMKATPAPDATMVPASSDLTVRFSEPVSGVSADTLGLFMGSAPIAGSVRYDASTQTAILTPSEPLPTDASLTARISTGITDLGGNALPASSWSFSTSPGEALSPWRQVVFAAGTYVGYRLDGDGHILAARIGRLGRASGASTSQRSA